ncbi:MAG: hypothetical protein ABL921_31505 [Pirellula sp.]
MLLFELFCQRKRHNTRLTMKKEDKIAYTILGVGVFAVLPFVIYKTNHHPASSVTASGDVVETTTPGAHALTPQPTKEIGAILDATIPGMSLPAYLYDEKPIDRLTRMADRTTSFSDSTGSKEVFNDWVSGVKDATGEDMKGVRGATLIYMWHPWFDKNVFKLDAAKVNVARCKQIKPEVIPQWQDVFKRMTGSPFGDLDLVMWLSDQGALYPQGRWDDAVNSRLLKRLENVPTGRPKELAEAARIGVNTAYLSIILKDAIYVDNEFSVPQFEKWLDLIKQTQTK